MLQEIDRYHSAERFRAKIKLMIKWLNFSFMIMEVYEIQVLSDSALMMHINGNEFQCWIDVYRGVGGGVCVILQFFLSFPAGQKWWSVK